MFPLVLTPQTHRKNRDPGFLSGAPDDLPVGLVFGAMVLGYDGARAEIAVCDLAARVGIAESAILAAAAWIDRRAWFLVEVVASPAPSGGATLVCWPDAEWMAETPADWVFGALAAYRQARERATIALEVVRVHGAPDAS